MRQFCADARQHKRPMAIVTRRLGHALAGAAEAVKIALASQAVDGGALRIDLARVEAGLAPDRVHALYFTAARRARVR